MAGFLICRVGSVRLSGVIHCCTRRGKEMSQVDIVLSASAAGGNDDPKTK
jgi:hypothetical protein